MKKSVNAIIICNKKVFLVQRKEGLHSKKWAFPGGIIEENESVEDALKREIKEETGMTIQKIIKKVGVYEYLDENDEKVLGESYIISVKNKKLNINEKEIENWKWATIEELEKLELAPGIEEEVMLSAEYFFNPAKEKE